MEEKEKQVGFNKNGQIKVSQNPKDGIRKLGSPDEKEFGIDDLVEESIKEEVENVDNSSNG